MMNSLKDKVAVITGASRGIGFAIARELEKQGVRPVFTAKENLSALKSFKSAKIIKLDLAKRSDIDLLIDDVVKFFLRLISLLITQLILNKPILS